MLLLTVFAISIFTTFILTRVAAIKLHDKKRYGTKKEFSFTPTGYLRKKTGYDWHHFHFGIIVLLITIPWILLQGISTISTIILAVGISWILDQGVPIIYRKSNYFSIRNTLISLTMHLLAVIVFYFSYQ